MATLLRGDFVRVKKTSDFRPGQDGMVVSPDDGEAAGLVFGIDRYNRMPSDIGITCTMLTEEWFLEELDLTTVEH